MSLPPHSSGRPTGVGCPCPSLHARHSSSGLVGLPESVSYLSLRSVVAAIGPRPAMPRSSSRSGMLAIVDTGPLYATVDSDDQDHERCRAVLERRDLELVVPALVVAEAAYLIGRRLGPKIEASFVRGLGELEVEAPAVDDWGLIADLVERYGDFPLGATDASVVTLAERLDTTLIVTLDRRHFAALRSNAGGSFELLP